MLKVRTFRYSDFQNIKNLNTRTFAYSKFQVRDSSQPARRLSTNSLKSLSLPDLSNAIFTPPAEEVAEARKILAAFELPENASRGAIQLDGRMVERLHAQMAERTIAIADAIAAMGH